MASSAEKWRGSMDGAHIRSDGKSERKDGQSEDKLSRSESTQSLTSRQSLAHWGNSRVTGRGLLALAGAGQIYQVSLKAGEQYVAHPRYIY